MEARVVHPDERADPAPEAPGQFAEPTEETAAVVVGAKDALAAVPAVDDVAPATGNGHAQGPGHAASHPGLDAMSII